MATDERENMRIDQRRFLEQQCPRTFPRWTIILVDQVEAELTAHVNIVDLQHEHRRRDET